MEDQGTNTNKKQRVNIWKIILVFAFLPFALTYFVLRSRLHIILKVLIIVIFWGFVFIIGSSSEKQESKNAPSSQPVSQSQASNDNSQNKSQSESETQKSIQQEEFMKTYKDTIDIVYPIKKIFYTTNGLLTKVPTITSYQNYKRAEETYKECSVYFTFASTPVSLKNFEKDFEQSYEELSIACVILQEDAKYMADYINTNNMESYRKSQEELKKGPIKIIANAISRLVYGVGEKIGIDIEPLNKEFKEMSERIPKDFEAEYGKYGK